MTIESHGHEHEFEPQFGLPERLPAGERILWQGSPDFRALARNAFHLRKLALYFSVLLVARATLPVTGMADLAERHRRLAEITEMIHTASLVHDDVLDECDIRRGEWPGCTSSSQTSHISAVLGQGQCNGASRQH